MRVRRVIFHGPEDRDRAERALAASVLWTVHATPIRLTLAAGWRLRLVVPAGAPLRWPTWCRWSRVYLPQWLLTLFQPAGVRMKGATT